MSFYLAIDIGASSGRHILGSVENGKLVLEEIYRFDNNIIKKDGNVLWDIKHLFSEVLAGIKECGKVNKIPSTIAIDTWGVDYVLFDKDEKEIMPVYSYRDDRTVAAMDKVEEIIPLKELYSHTGIQKMAYNTIYQLYCDKQSGRLDKAERMLMIPEYLSYKLTGVMMNEYTNASTTALLNAKEHTWDEEILDRMGIDKKLFDSPKVPPAFLGKLSDTIREEVGFDADVILCPSHDTASAVAACPLFDDSMYISSGTWSLVGVELPEPVTDDKAFESNFTNEGGIEYRIRFLKNIMGMWLFQNIRRDLDKKYTYDEMMHMAEESTFTQTIDTNAPELVAPDNMIEAIRTMLGQPELPVADVISCVYHSLAASYTNVMEEIERVTGKKISSVLIVGGGSVDTYLNRLTSKYSGRKVFTGLKEATATGNIMAQYMYENKGTTLNDCRDIIRNTFEVKETIV